MLQKPSLSRTHFRIQEPSYGGRSSVRQSLATAYTVSLHNSLLSNEASEGTLLKPLRLKGLTIHLLLFHLQERIK